MFGFLKKTQPPPRSPERNSGVASNHTEVMVDLHAARASDFETQVSRVTERARQALSAKSRLCPQAARLQCLPIHRGDAFCGMHFALHGPRDVLFTAVWDAQSNTLWCYDSRGERFLRTAAQND